MIYTLGRASTQQQPLPHNTTFLLLRTIFFFLYLDYVICLKEKALVEKMFTSHSQKFCKSKAYLWQCGREFTD